MLDPSEHKIFWQHFSTYVSQNVYVCGNSQNLFFIILVAELVPRCRYPCQYSSYSQALQKYVKYLANSVYRRIFDVVFVMTSVEMPIRRDVFAFYSGEYTSDVLLQGLSVSLHPESLPTFVSLRICTAVLRLYQQLGFVKISKGFDPNKYGIYGGRFHITGREHSLSSVFVNSNSNSN